MKVEKYIEDIVKLDSFNMYTSDLKGTLIEILKAKYSGRNFKGCHILSILEIVRHSSRDITHTNNSFVTVSCVFKAECYVFDMGETIFCKILKKEHKFVQASNEYAGIKIINTAKFDPFIVGKVMPVSVRAAAYEVGASKVTIIAIPFVPMTKLIYKVVSIDVKELDSEPTKMYIDYLKKSIKHEEKKFKKDKSFTWFKKMTEKPYKGTNHWDDFKSIVPGDIITSEPCQLELNLTKTDPGTGNVYDENLSIIIVKSLHNHLKYITMLNELTKQYNTSISIKELSLTWKLYTYYAASK